MSPTSKILTIRSIPILIACLLGLAPVAFSQADKDLCTKLGKPPKTKGTIPVCVDLKAPVTPLPLELSPNVKLSIQIVSKSPWQKVSIDLKRSVIEDPTDALLISLVKRLGPFWNSLIPEVSTTGNARILMDIQAAEKDKDQNPFTTLFTDLGTMYDKLDEDRAKREKDLKDANVKAENAKTVAQTHLGFISQATNYDEYNKKLATANSAFGRELNVAVDALDALPALKSPSGVATPDDAKAKLERINFMASSQIYLNLDEKQRKYVDDTLGSDVIRQRKVEAAFAKLTQDESAAAASLALFKAVKGEEGSGWFEYLKQVSETENRKASVTVKLEDRGSPGAAKSDVVAFDATWKKPVPVSLSLGFAMTSLARTDFSVTTAPGVSGATPTYQLSATSTHPIAFPLVLLHYDIPHALPATHWGFAFSGGAGADVSGSTPTGEFAGGGSLRYRSIYLSGLLQFGRRKALLSGHALGDTVPAGSTPPTQDVWGKGFAFAITYRAPL